MDNFRTARRLSSRHSTRDTQVEFLCWGCNEHGQAADGASKNVSSVNGVLREFSGKTRETTIKLAACGSSHTIVVTYSNSIYVWGNGHCGQLGIGDTDSYREPKEIQLYSLQPENPSIQGVACGGKHTFVWLANGHMFSFGNNSYGQLGYDHKMKNYKENQKRPHLLRTLTHRCVAQVACGQKHTVMLFKDGSVATVGNGAHGQIGDDSRSEAVTPKLLENMPAIVQIAAGAFHTLAIDVLGEVWNWGMGEACGRKKNDVLVPERRDLPRPNAVQVDGGQTHSAVLTANGNLYTWGSGPDGQLGHGENTTFLSNPRRLQSQHLRNRVVRVACGDAFTAALTEAGELFIWGRASHVICQDKGPGFQIWSPRMIDTGGRPIKSMHCGAWHVCAVTGVTEWRKADNASDTEDTSLIIEPEYETDSFGESDEEEIPIERPTLFTREKTAISLADFYAPSPSPTGPGLSPSPDSMIGKRKNYYKGLPPPKGVKRRHSKQDKQAPPPTKPQPKEDYIQSRIQSPSRRASRDSNIVSNDVLARKSSLQRDDGSIQTRQFTYTDSRKQSLSSDKEPNEPGSRPPRQVTFVEDSGGLDPTSVEEADENMSQTSSQRIGPGLHPSDRMRSPLKMNNSSAVDLSKDANLGAKRRLSSQNSKLSSDDLLQDGNELNTLHLPGICGKTNLSSSPHALRPNSILKSTKPKNKIKEEPSLTSHRNSIPFKDTRGSLLGNRSVSFAQAPQLVQDSSRKMPKIEREPSMIRQSLIEFPNSADHGPKFRKITQPLRMDTMYRQSTTIKSRDGRTITSYAATQNLSAREPPKSVPKPLLMNTIFAKGLNEIRHSNHSHLLSETARPPYQNIAHHNETSTAKQHKRPSTDRTSQASRNKPSSRRSLGAVSTENLPSSPDKWPLDDLYKSISEGNSPNATAYKPRSLDHMSKLHGNRGISSRHSLSNQTRLRSQKQQLWMSRGQQASFV